MGGGGDAEARGEKGTGLEMRAREKVRGFSPTERQGRVRQIFFCLGSGSS